MTDPNPAMKMWLANAEADERQRVADFASISVGYLWLLAGGHRKPSESVAAAIHQATSGAVPAISFFPMLAELLPCEIVTPCSEPLPTLTQTILPTATQHSSTGGAVNPSSVAQASP